MNELIKLNIKSDGEEFVEIKSVEAKILFSILEKLEEIRCGLIDIENTMENIK